MFLRIILAGTIVGFGLTTVHAGVSRALRDQLKSHYEGRNVTAVRPGLSKASYWTNLPTGRGRNRLHSNIVLFQSQNQGQETHSRQAPSSPRNVRKTETSRGRPRPS